MSGRFLITSQEAAAIAGVTVSTLKRWSDAGNLTYIRTAGGHRRFERAEVERFLRAHTAAPPQEPEHWLMRWLDPMRRGDRDGLQTRLFEARDRLGAWHLVADELVLVLNDLQRRHGIRELNSAHLQWINECLHRCLARVVDVLPVQSPNKRVLLVCGPGDVTTTGLLLAEICMRELGWDPIWLGCAAPADDIARMIETPEEIDPTDLHMVVLWACNASTSADILYAFARNTVAACRPRLIPLVLGGAGAWPDHMPGCVRVTSFNQLNAFGGVL